MPEKEGAEEKSTKSVVSKKQKQMMGEEGYDIARDQGRVRPSKDKKDATTLRKPPSEEMRNTQIVNTGPSAYELIKKKYKGQIMNVGKKGKKKVQDEFDLTQVAKAFGGYIIEAPIQKDGSFKPDEEEKKKNVRANKKFSQKYSQSFKRQDQDAEISDRKKRQRQQQQSAIDPRRPGFEDEEQQGAGFQTPAQKSDARIRQARKDAAKERRAEKLQDPKFRASETLKKAKQTDIKGGPSVKRGDPVPQEVEPVKKKSVPEIGGFQRNTFKPEIMSRRKTFKQAFGQPTGADPVTGKPTYMRPGVLDKDGKPRPAQKRSKNLPDVDTVKTAIDMGVNPDEIDKNKFIDQKVRVNRAIRLGTPDPFDPDYDKKVKKPVDKRTKIGKKIDKVFNAPKFQTTQRPMEVDKQTEVDAEKIGSQLKKTKKGFKDFDRGMRDAKVDADIERTIAGSGGGGRKTKIGSGTALDPEVVKNGRAKNAIDVTNYKEPSLFSQAKDRASNFAKNNPAAALAAYDMGKGILGKIMKFRPSIKGGRAGLRSAAR